MKTTEYLETLEGEEIRSTEFDTEDGIVLVENGKIIQCGKVIVSKPTKSQLKQLFDDLIYQEFGGSPVI